MVSLVDLEVGIFVVDIVDLVLGVVDLEDGLVDIDVRSEKTYMIICHTKTNSVRADNRYDRLSADISIIGRLSVLPIS